MPRFWFFGRFSKLLDVHMQMKEAGCLEAFTGAGSAEFPPKAGVLESVTLTLGSEAHIDLVMTRGYVHLLSRCPAAQLATGSVRSASLLDGWPADLGLQ